MTREPLIFGNDLGFFGAGSGELCHDLHAMLIKDVKNILAQGASHILHFFRLITVGIQFIEHTKISHALLQDKRK